MKINRKYGFIVLGVILLIVFSLYHTSAFDNNSLLSSLNISIDSENNLTTTIIPEENVFLKNPYKGYSSEDAYVQTTGVIDLRDSALKYSSEGYLRLNWYLFYKNSFIGPTDATDYKDEAYDWSVLFDLIKLYADNGMKLRFGVMTANTTSTDGAISNYKSLSSGANLSAWNTTTLTDLVMPKGSVIPKADYIPVISLNNNKIKLTCGDVDCRDFDDSGYDKYTHTKYVVEEDEIVYKARNITPMWMFEGIPIGYDEDGAPLYDENAVKWYLDINNVHWLPKWDDQNLINNIDDFVQAMADYLKNEEYNGKKLIDYISYVEVRSFGNYGENHFDQTSLNSVNDEFRNPLLCGYLDTSAHNYLYAYQKDTNFVYPENCYFDLNGQDVKIYSGQDWHFSYIDTIKYYVNVSFEFYYEKYLKTYIDAFEDTDVRLVMNWASFWDYDYYYDKGYVFNDTIRELLEMYNNYLTIRTDSVFGSSFGEGSQLAQANGLVPTAFEYMFARYVSQYNKDTYFPSLKEKININNLCTNKYNCLTEYFVYAVEQSRATYMDFNYVLYDYYENFINGIEDDYLLDLDYLGNSLGYHFVLKNASFNTKVDLSEEQSNLNVNFNVVNDGVTYLYDEDDTKVYLALLETDGNGNVITDSNDKSVVASKFLTDIDPTLWKSSMDISGNRDSSDENNWINETIDVNVGEIDAGKYIVALGLFTDFDENYPTIKLGNKGGTIDNWYALGEIELASSNNNKTGILTVHHYIDGTEVKVEKDDVSEVVVGNKYNTSYIKKDGYSFVFSSNNTSGIMNEDGVTVTYYYKRNKFRISDYYNIKTLARVINNETGEGEAVIIKQIQDTIDKLENGEITELTYELFGADILEDDTYPMKAAHAIATYENLYNGKNFVVKGTPGATYYLGNDTVNNNLFWMEAGTSIDWQGSTIILDDGSFDANVSSDKSRLHHRVLTIDSKMLYKSRKRSLDLNEKAIDSINFKLNKSTTKLENLANFIKNINETDSSYYVDTSEIQIAVIDREFKNVEQYMVIVYDDNQRINIKDGIDYYPPASTVGNPEQDRFIMDKDGNILSDLFVDFKEVTKISIFPIYNETITIENGNFLTKTNNQVYDSNGNFHGMIDRGMYITASNVVISNINHELDEEAYLNINETQDKGNANHYLSFLSFYESANIIIKDSNFSAHASPTAYDKNTGKLLNNGSATYDMLISNCLNVKLDNVGYIVKENESDEEAYFKNILDRNGRWSTIIFNYSKNVHANNVKLNSYSCHDGMYNFSIENSIVGSRGFVLSGGGYFKANNVLMDNARNLIRFHYDIDSSWDGSVSITNSKLILPTLNWYAYLINTVRYEDLYFGVEQPYFPSIELENLEIDDSNLKNDASKIILIGYNEDILEVVENPIRKYYMNNKISVKNMNITNRKLTVFTDKFVKDGRLNQSYYVNNEDEITDVILENIDLAEDINKYNIDGGQFKVIAQRLKFNNLNIDSDNMFITNIIKNYTVNDLKNDIDTTGKIKIINNKNIELINSDAIGTGCTLEIQLETRTDTYKTVLLGDVSGDAKINVTDVAKLYQYVSKEIITMDDVYIQAGDIIEDKELNVTDVAKLYQYVREKREELR